MNSVRMFRLYSMLNNFTANQSAENENKQMKSE